MKQPLNGLESISTNSLYQSIKLDISAKFLEYSAQSLDAYFDLLNNLFWSSPLELAKNWIKQYVDDSWKELEEKPADTHEIKTLKYAFRRNILFMIGHRISELGKSPSILQRISTRLLVRRAFLSELTANDQDRILSAEIGINYRKWRELLIVLAQLKPEKPLQLLDLPHIIKDEHGESYQLSYNGNIGLNETGIDGLGIQVGKPPINLIQSNLGLVMNPATTLTVSREVLRRFEGAISDKSIESIYRQSFVNLLNAHVIIGKKMNFTGNFREKDEEPELNPMKS